MWKGLWRRKIDGLPRRWNPPDYTVDRVMLDQTVIAKETTSSKLMLRARDKSVAYQRRIDHIRLLHSVNTESFTNVQCMGPQQARLGSLSTCGEGVGQLFYISEAPIATKDLPKTIDESQEHSNQAEDVTQVLHAVDSAQIFKQARTVYLLKLARLNNSSTPNRAGWSKKPAVAKLVLIRHFCYEKAGHTSTNCTLTLTTVGV